MRFAAQEKRTRHDRRRSVFFISTSCRIIREADRDVKGEK
jgi:hypothetical protein